MSILGEGRQTECREKFNCNIISVKAPFNHIRVLNPLGSKVPSSPIAVKISHWMQPMLGRGASQSNRMLTAAVFPPSALSGVLPPSFLTGDLSVHLSTLS